jgi:hypothetical protein
VFVRGSEHSINIIIQERCSASIRCKLAELNA